MEAQDLAGEARGGTVDVMPLTVQRAEDPAWTLAGQLQIHLFSTHGNAPWYEQTNQTPQTLAGGQPCVLFPRYATTSEREGDQEECR
jgi:hypothetical protein